MYKPIGIEKDLEVFLYELSKDTKVSKLEGKELSNVLKPRLEEFFSYYALNIYKQERIEELKNRIIDGLPEYVKIENELKNSQIEGDFLRWFLWYNVGALPVIFLTGNLILSIIAGTLVGKIMKKPPVDSEKTKKLEQRADQMIDFWLR